MWRTPPPTSYAAVLAHQTAWDQLCERSGMPAVLCKFPLAVEKVKQEIDAETFESDLEERRQEAALKCHYAQLVHDIYQRRVLGMEAKAQPKHQPSEKCESIGNDNVPPRASDSIELAYAAPLAQNTCASELPELGTTPCDNNQEHVDHYVIPDQGETAGQDRVDDIYTAPQFHEQRPQHTLLQIPAISPQLSAEEMPQSPDERRKHTSLSENDYRLLQSIVTKYTNSANSLALSDEPRDKLKQPISQDATVEPLSAYSTLLFYRKRPYCYERDPQGFVWTGRSLLDEWDRTDEFEGTGFARLYSLSRPKRTDDEKMIEACKRLQSRTDTKEAWDRGKRAAERGYLKRNIRAVRADANFHRLPCHTEDEDVMDVLMANNVRLGIPQKRYRRKGRKRAKRRTSEDEEDGGDDAEILSVPRNERNPSRRSRRKRGQSDDAAEREIENEQPKRPKYGAPPSPPDRSRKRGRRRRQNLDTGTTEQPTARSKKTKEPPQPRAKMVEIRFPLRSKASASGTRSDDDSLSDDPLFSFPS